MIKPQQKSFILEAADEAAIQKLSDDIVEDAVYLLKINADNGNQQGRLGERNPYNGKETQDMLKYQINAALRKLGRERKIHFSQGVNKEQTQHPLLSYLKFYLFEAVCNEMKNPSI